MYYNEYHYSRIPTLYLIVSNVLYNLEHTSNVIAVFICPQ